MLLEQFFSQYFVYVFFAILIFLAAAGLAVKWLLESYLVPLRKLVEETALINTSNPSHRITPGGGGLVRRLAETINAGADKHQRLAESVEERIQEAKARIEEDKHTLAALVSELTEGVLALNLEGQILLYNRQAKTLLSHEADAADGARSVGGLVGLGRSVFGLIDRRLIVHALDDLTHQIEQGARNTVSHVVAAVENGRLLRILTLPVLDKDNRMSGLILVLYDITQQARTDSGRDSLVQSLTNGYRSSISSMRAAVENLTNYPDMDPSQRETFWKIIQDECATLSGLLDKTLDTYPESLETQWPLENMLGSNLLAMIGRRAPDGIALNLSTEGGDGVWVKIDSYSITQAVCFIIGELRALTGAGAYTLKLTKDRSFVCLDIVWKDAPVKAETMTQWESLLLASRVKGLALTLREVVERHNAQLWSQPEKDAGVSLVRILLPAAAPFEQKQAEPRRVSISSRPEFYDFDLFNHLRRDRDLEERNLSDLVYTVFDTETTGLDPSAGDEIISIGAVRIVNGRILRDETFDQLIDPRRPLSPESMKVHGIQPAMLEGQPTIDAVIPLFYRFAEDTVLVAHNAAFDMRFLQLKEKTTGIKFINPILDTLLLSAVVHPNQEEHVLEAIARRLGVNIIGRHTALGDAILTAEALLRIIPLLSERGIHTLGEARHASAKTYYARIKF